ncbi:MAG: hypothetical protein AB1505_19985 [Candidatus Latescibacterota bacterium]
MNEAKRRENERKFGHWQHRSDGGRQHSYTVAGRRGWTARYVKEVDAEEVTVRFVQEIYSPQGELVAGHQKFPSDTGHRLPGSAPCT